MPAPETWSKAMVNTKFKPGKSGNPKGRPRGSRNFEAQFLAEMSALVDGDPQKISKLQAILRSQADRAIAGDTRASQAILNRMEKAEARLDAAEQGLSFTKDDREVIAEIRRMLSSAQKPSSLQKLSSPSSGGGGERGSTEGSEGAGGTERADAA
jgi:hypothetical protein